MIQDTPEHLRKGIEVMFRTTTEASLICRKLRKEFDEEKVMNKSDESPVTLADISAQIVINHRLESAFPGVSIIGEEDSTEISDQLFEKIKEIFQTHTDDPEFRFETKDSITRVLKSNPINASTKEFWTVDPIDGTKGFIRGDQYAVCLALIDKSTQLPIMSALGCPNLAYSETDKGMVLVSVKGFGNYKCKLGSGMDALEKMPKVTLQGNLSNVTCTGAVVSTHTNPKEIDKIKMKFDNQVPVLRMDSQCKYVLLALARAHVYYRRHAPKDSSPRRHWKCDYVEAIWDNAPGYLFVKEAGGMVTDFAGNDLLFPAEKNFVVVGGILASTLEPHLHQKLIETVQELNSE